MGIEESFFHAVSSGNIELTARALISETLNINAKNNLGQTAIFIAASNRDLCICEMLIAFGADPTIKSQNGLSASSILSLDLNALKDNEYKEHVGYKESRESIGEMFFSAVLNRKIKKIIKMLVGSSTLDINMQDKDGKITAYLSAEKNDSCLLKILSAFGADLNKKENQSGYTALSAAVLNDNCNMVEALLNLGVRQDIGDVRGNFPIHLASEMGNHNIIKSLLKCSSIENFINVVNHSGFTPLHLTVKCNNVKAVMELLECPYVDVSVCDGVNGETALAMATKNDDLEMVRVLLEHKTNPNLKDSDGATFSNFVVLQEMEPMETSINLCRPIIYRPFKRKIDMPCKSPASKRRNLMDEMSHPLKSLEDKCELILSKTASNSNPLTQKREGLVDISNTNPTCRDQKLSGALSDSSPRSTPSSSGISDKYARFNISGSEYSSSPRSILSDSEFSNQYTPSASLYVGSPEHLGHK